MIDTLETNREIASALALSDIINNNLLRVYKFRGVTPPDSVYAVMTLHRSSNVDHEKILFPLIKFLLDEVTKDLTLIWPVHPRA